MAVFRPRSAGLWEAAAYDKGALVAAPGGRRPVGVLRAGEKVLTRDAGAQAALWAGRANLLPILALAPGVRVTPGCRILLSVPGANRLCVWDEGLASAEDIVSADTQLRPCVALLLRGQALIWLGGLWCETLLPDADRLGEFDAVARRSLRRAHPRTGEGRRPMRPRAPFWTRGRLRYCDGSYQRPKLLTALA